MGQKADHSGLVLPPVRRSFRALAGTILPETRTMGPFAWERAEHIVENALAPRPPALKRQLRFFIRAADWLAVLRWGRPFHRLQPEARVRWLEILESAPLLAIRRGFWGLRTLVFMGYYGQESIHEEIGYRARSGGWEARSELPADGPTEREGEGEGEKKGEGEGEEGGVRK